MYFVRCVDNTLYCGITNNLKKRILAHNFGPNGAKYTRSRRPVSLVWHRTAGTRSEASKIEYKLKKLKKLDKELIIKKNLDYDAQIINFETEAGRRS